MNDTMMAAVLYAPGDLRYEKAKIPLIKEYEVLLRVKVAGNCGSDLQRIMVEGTYHFPCIPGHEFSGEIVKVGKDVKNVIVGDRVTSIPLIPCMKCEWCLQGQYNMCEDYDYLGSRSNGAFAEYVKVPASNVIKLPENVDFEDAAMMDPAAVGLHAIKRAGGIRIGETVAILGAGPIGMLICQWAKIMGAKKLIASDIVNEKLQIIKSLGIDVIINAKEEDVVERILKETGGFGADMIIETAGSVQTHIQSLQATRKRGKVIHVGRAYKDILLPDAVFTRIYRKELNVYGSVNFNFANHDNEGKIAVQYMSMGRIKPKILISHRLLLRDIAETFSKMYYKEIIYNKIIFTP
jgi:L-iditol 2-dehydrogenase